MSTLLRMLFIAFVTGVLVGCAGPMMDPQVKQSIRTVSIEPVTLPEKPTVALPGSGVAALLTGGIGLAALQSTGSDVQLAYKMVLARYVDVGAEIKRHLKAQLEQKGYTVVLSGERADAKLITNATYGIGLVSLTGDDRAVATTISVQLTRTSDGKVVYRTQNFTGTDKSLLAKIRVAPFAQWFEDGALVAEQHKLVAELVANDVMKGL